MIISYYGYTAFKIQTKRNNGTNIIINPIKEDFGFKFPKTDGNVLLLSNKSSKFYDTKKVTGKPYLINCAGEYDVNEIGIKGIQDKNNIVYRITVEGVSITHLGELAKELSTSQLEEINGTDILIIPVGGNTIVNAKKAKEIASQIEPRIIIPMCYKTEKSIQDFDELNKFISEMSLKPSDEEKLKITKKDLPQEDTELVVLGIN